MQTFSGRTFSRDTEHPLSLSMVLAGNSMVDYLMYLLFSD